MRWIRIRKAATLDPELRETFERYGVASMQLFLSSQKHFRHKGSLTSTDAVLEPLMAWLTEEYDTADLKATWSLTMEIAITVFVAWELVLMLRNSCP